MVFHESFWWGRRRMDEFVVIVIQHTHTITFVVIETLERSTFFCFVYGFWFRCLNARYRKPLMSIIQPTSDNAVFTTRLDTISPPNPQQFGEHMTLGMNVIAVLGARDVTYHFDCHIDYDTRYLM